MNNPDKLQRTLLRAARASEGPMPREAGFEQRVLAGLDAAEPESPWLALGAAARLLAPALAAIVLALGVTYTLSAPDDLLAMNDALINSALWGTTE